MANNLNARFAMNPNRLLTKRSRFDMPFNHKGTFNTGDLVLFANIEVYPGDTFSAKETIILRGSTPIVPVMDNAFLDLYWFFVPYRLVWDDSKAFFGENTEGPWVDEYEYSVPQVHYQTGEVIPFDSLADDIGLPAGFKNNGEEDISFSALPARAYINIWNEWFRDQNLQDPEYFERDSTDSYYVKGSSTGSNVYGTRLKLCKYHDYFTSALPQPQKGPAVSIPLSGDIPVFAGEEISLSKVSELNGTHSLSFAFQSGNVNDWYNSAEEHGVLAVNATKNQAILGDTQFGTTTTRMTPNNLYARLSDATSVTINALRQAFAIQALYEIDARSGTRYRESVKAHFGAIIDDRTVQVPEYLAGRRIPVHVNQVLQTSSTNEVSPQGNTGAFSLTADSEGVFSKSFSEHGYLMCVGGVRTVHTYQQGIPVYMQRKRRFDFYYPELANLGEQPIKNKTLVLTGSERDDETFGFNEAWAELRYLPSYVSGSFRNNYSGSLAYWHYADYFGDAESNEPQCPYLNFEFIKEVPNNVDRTLAVQSSEHAQWLYDLQIDFVATRVLPLYSIPGLSRHA